MIDSHCHITKGFYDDIDSVINLLKENNMKAIIDVADSLKSANEVLDYSKKYSNYVFPTVGIHPENINSCTIESLNTMESMIKESSFVAIGEIGLDYHFDNTNKDEQKKLFIEQINLAEKYKLPIVVHTRDSIGDVLDILKEHDVKGVIHCFSGSLEMAREFIKLGFYLGIGGVLTFKNSNLYKVIDQIDINSLLLETDSPFLSPEPVRGKKNIPSNVKYVAEKIAQIKSISIDKVIEITTKNACILFDLDI